MQIHHILCLPVVPRSTRPLLSRCERLREILSRLMIRSCTMRRDSSPGRTGTNIVIYAVRFPHAHTRTRCSLRDSTFSTLGELVRKPARPSWRTMDEDGEADSLSELSPCSLSCWMMKNLLHQETVANEKLSLSLPDTVLLQDGHLFHWLFTSSKSGSVVKVRVIFYCASPASPSGRPRVEQLQYSIVSCLQSVPLCKIAQEIPPHTSQDGVLPVALTLQPYHMDAQSYRHGIETVTNSGQ